MTTGLERAAIALALALTLGCGSLPVTRHYTLGPAGGAGTEGGAMKSGAGLSIGIEGFAVDPPYDQDRLVYRRGPDSTEVGFYSYDRWAAPLDRMLPVALAGGLGGTPGIASIEPAVSGKRYQATLRGRLLHLEEVASAGGQQARIALELELLNESGEPLWSGRLSGYAEGPAGEGPEAAELMAEAFEDLLSRARRELAAALGAGT